MGARGPGAGTAAAEGSLFAGGACGHGATARAASASKPLTQPRILIPVRDVDTAGARGLGTGAAAVGSVMANTARAAATPLIMTYVTTR